jgi:hypothetical protein
METYLTLPFILEAFIGFNITTAGNLTVKEEKSTSLCFLTKRAGNEKPVRK